VESLRVILQQQAVRDFLTGLFNRRHLNEILPSMRALAQRDGQPLAVAIIDLDHFKDVNDRCGHLVGDRVLAEFGRLLTAKLRRSDVACRYGGEEFCLLLPRTDARAAMRKLTALLRCWREKHCFVDGVDIAGSSFSAGVADSLQVPQSAEALLQAADQCVLEAKRGGRGRVVVYDEEESRPAPTQAAVRATETSPAA
jgi:two-component system, cell cycle response regulator